MRVLPHSFFSLLPVIGEAGEECTATVFEASQNKAGLQKRGTSASYFRQTLSVFVFFFAKYFSPANRIMM